MQVSKNGLFWVFVCVERSIKSVRPVERGCCLRGKISNIMRTIVIIAQFVSLNPFHCYDRFCVGSISNGRGFFKNHRMWIQMKAHARWKSVLHALMLCGQPDWTGKNSRTNCNPSAALCKMNRPHPKDAAFIPFSAQRLVTNHLFLKIISWSVERQSRCTKLYLRHRWVYEVLWTHVDRCFCFARITQIRALACCFTT